MTQEFKDGRYSATDDTTAVFPHRLCLAISMQVSGRFPLIAESKHPLPNEDLFFTSAPRFSNNRTMRALPKYAARSMGVV